MNLHALYRVFFRYFRSRRMRRFAQYFALTPRHRVLDLGGSWFNWSLLPETERPNLLIVNVYRTPHGANGVSYIVADGCALPFADKTFEIVYSNSVIEHLGHAERQAQFAAEAQRVGSRYYIQTPNRAFPIEPHYLALGIHWLPKAWQRRLVRWFSLRGWIERPSQARIDALVEELRLLHHAELARLFPDSAIWTENLLGLRKSLMAVGPLSAKPLVSQLPAATPRFPVVDVQISALTFDQALQTLDRWIAQRERHYVNICTTHTVLECHDTPALAEVVNGAGMATPDGMPLVWLGRLHGHFVERVYGPDVMLAACAQGLTRGYRHFFYGGAEGVAERLAERLQAQFPGLQVAGTYTPPFRPLTSADEQQIAELINASQADLVWVGLGTPKQDYWVARFRPLLDAPVLLAVGAAFDFHAGRVRQAPRWMQRSGLEWLFRLTQDPKRLWRRYIIGNPRFVYLVARRLLRDRMNHVP
ncbi:MAG: WecB/TagA/CpsF family glycosyltransferase [Oscillochloridaceae bacterium umkhey_bin13]